MKRSLETSRGTNINRYSFFSALRRFLNALLRSKSMYNLENTFQNFSNDCFDQQPSAMNRHFIAAWYKEIMTLVCDTLSAQTDFYMCS